jgi:hypothetical protein
MSVSRTARDRPGVEAVAGLLAAAALFIGLTAIVYRPARLAPAAIVMALLSVGISRRWSRLAALAAAVSGFGWLIGMTIAVLTNHPIF